MTAHAACEHERLRLRPAHGEPALDEHDVQALLHHGEISRDPCRTRGLFGDPRDFRCETATLPLRVAIRDRVHDLREDARLDG